MASGPRIELDDMQGLLRRGYGHLQASRYVMLTITLPEACRTWLGGLEIATASPGGTEQTTEAIQLAFTYPGLRALAPQARLQNFAREFVEGMTAPHRARVLGDHPGSPNDANDWLWGGPKTPEVHVLVALFAVDPRGLEALCERVLRAAQGVRVTYRIDSHALEGEREHFGFRDGISKVVVREDQSECDGPTEVRAGEFMLGYRNEAGCVAPTPAFDEHLDPSDPREGRWGRNGTYLVFRQIEQHVEVFWDFMRAEAKRSLASMHPRSAVEIAAKVVGRWPNGAPLTLAPNGEQDVGAVDAFGYAASDKPGWRCPVHAHIRRANPRDDFVDTPEESLTRLKSHRLLRRGRVYGTPCDPAVYPNEARVASLFPESGSADADGRGLLFLCLNANLATQFEFVQQTWINSSKFRGATNSRDVTSSPPPARSDDAHTTFVIPDPVLHQRISGIPSFIRIRGGAYFFVPGIRALAVLLQSAARPQETPHSTSP